MHDCVWKVKSKPIIISLKPYKMTTVKIELSDKLVRSLTAFCRAIGVRKVEVLPPTSIDQIGTDEA
ncbi:MAG: hypothetical protein RI894_961 [Bacteroidota bacterium]|jgi:hypothetical protein